MEACSALRAKGDAMRAGPLGDRKVADYCVRIAEGLPAQRIVGEGGGDGRIVA